MDLDILKTLFNKKKVTITQICELSGLAQQTIHSLLKRQSTSTLTIDTIAEAINCRAHLVFEDLNTGEIIHEINSSDFSNRTQENTNSNIINSLTETNSLLVKLLAEKDRRIKELEETVKKSR